MVILLGIACRILVPRLGMKPLPPGVLTTGRPREVPGLSRRKRSASWFSYPLQIKITCGSLVT